MSQFELKDPFGAYQPRLTRFLEMMVEVRGLEPADIQLWKIMDSMAFQDTETALEIAIYNTIMAKTDRLKPAND